MADMSSNHTEPNQTKLALLPVCLFLDKFTPFTKLRKHSRFIHVP